MKTADLYIRVSTDEQADKGYSQRNQEEVLKKYCEINRISIKRVVFEDHSAKTFNRPAGIFFYQNFENTKARPTWCYSPNGTVSVEMPGMPTK
jgi:site-specific DNA recombinase